MVKAMAASDAPGIHPSTTPAHSTGKSPAKLIAVAQAITAVDLALTWIPRSQLCIAASTGSSTAHRSAGKAKAISLV